MRTKGKERLFTILVVLVCMTLLIGATDASAKKPKGTLKEAIHWGISADWLDPATVAEDDYGCQFTYPDRSGLPPCP